jgi:hypothetical protein
VHACFKGGGGDDQDLDGPVGGATAVLSMTFAQVRQLLDLVMTPDWTTYFAERDTAFHSHSHHMAQASSTASSSEHHQISAAAAASPSSAASTGGGANNKKYPRVKASHAAALLEK